MGWSGGTEIFDDVVGSLYGITDGDGLPREYCRLLRDLLVVLEDQDWDNQCESNYYDDPVIGTILGNPELLEEE